MIRRALAAAGLVAILEPRGRDRGDARRLDGNTDFPFRRSKMLVWDATCVNTFPSTHIIDCASAAGAAARATEERKRQHYAALAQHYEFVPLTAGCCDAQPVCVFVCVYVCVCVDGWLGCVPGWKEGEATVGSRCPEAHKLPLRCRASRQG